MPANLYLADAIADATGLFAAPAAILIDPSGTVLKAGTPEDVSQHPDAPAASVHEHPGTLILPGLINAHTHLDLTHMGPRPFDQSAGFVGWVRMVIAERATTPDEITRSVTLGVERSLAGGVVAVGDIAGAIRGQAHASAAQTLFKSELAGVSYQEFMAIGTTEDRAQACLADLDTPNERQIDPAATRIGISPHAPNTVGTTAYRLAAQHAATRGLPLATHLAETPEERAFIQHGTGPQRELLESLGIWTDDLARTLGQGAHPIDHTLDALGDLPASTCLIHVNDCPDAQLERLARSNASIVYCPRASDYFGRHHDFGPHRYQDMLARGINVALGTDSIINLDTGRISTLDDARFLRARDRADPMILLKMITSNAATAIGFTPERATLTAGSRPLGLVAIPVTRPSSALEEVFDGDADPTILFAAKTSGFTGSHRDFT